MSSPASFSLYSNRVELCSVVYTEPDAVPVVTIKDPFLRTQMQKNGVQVDAGVRQLYDGKRAVKLKDPDFGRAFTELFVDRAIKRNNYEKRLHKK